MGARVLILSDRPALIRSATRALVSAGYEVTSAIRRTDVLDRELAKPTELVLIDADGPAYESRIFVNMARQREGVRVLLLGRTVNEETPVEADALWLDDVSVRHGLLHTTAEVFDEAELIIAARKMLSANLFGMERYMPVRDLPIHDHVLRSSNDRGPALDAFGDYLGELGCFATVSSMLLTVADELMMNAVFSAPRDASGQVKYGELPRSSEFALEPNEAVHFRYTSDGRSVYVSVIDAFGALESKQILRSLGPRLSGRMDRAREKLTGGAGLGLPLTFGWVDQLVFNIERGRRTEVIAGRRVRRGGKADSTLGRTFGIFHG
jgi:hypothetical protein